MTAEIISVGTELLLGNIINTNAVFLAEECASLGISVYWQMVVGDNAERLSEAMRSASEHADYVILTGGLGPTQDDITKETAAKVMNMPLIDDAHTRSRIQEYFDKLAKKHIADNNWKQALVPDGAIVIDNVNGTAPGLIMEGKNVTMILLPGPPDELIPMWHNSIVPYLEHHQTVVIRSRTVKLCGIGESDAETMIRDIIDEQTNPTVATYAKIGEVHLRVTAKAGDKDEANRLLDSMVSKIGERFGSSIYTCSKHVSLEMYFVELLTERGYKAATAESCTGGMLAGRIVNVPGASEVFEYGFITYSNEAKINMLDVSPETLRHYGAVSYETACEMACGAARNAGADVAIATTGIAGPDGGTPEKPVGLVYIGIYTDGHVKAYECHFPGDRDKIRAYTTARALTLAGAEIIAHH